MPLLFENWKQKNIFITPAVKHQSQCYQAVLSIKMSDLWQKLRKYVNIYKTKTKIKSKSNQTQIKCLKLI